MMIQKGVLGLAMLVALTAAANSRYCSEDYGSVGGAQFHYTIDGIYDTKYWESTVW